MRDLGPRWLCVLAVWLAIAAWPPMRLGAQPSAPSQPATFVHLQSGDCRIIVELPATISVGTVRLSRNGNETTAQPRRTGIATATVRRVAFDVLEPPQLNDEFTISAVGLSSKSERVRVVGRDRTRCSIKDEREVFAPTILFGLSADAFAPNEERFYPTTDNPDQDPYKLRNSMIVRIDAQIRVGGNHGGVLDRFWVAAAMKYGVRSTDLECEGKDKDAPNCRNALAVPKNPGELLTAAVLRASKIEAIIKPRYEFATLFPDSDFPVALYGLGRFGFGQAPGEVKVENVYSAGGGFMFLAGVFRESGVETTWGLDRGYRTNPDGKRMRSDFKLLFGKAPGFLAQIPYVSKLAQAPRGLIEVIVDRNSLGPGPDGTQTFLGVVIAIDKVMP